MLTLSAAAVVASWTPIVAPQAPPPSEMTLQPVWTWSVSGYGVDPPHDDAYTALFLRADRGALHLEGRYNYEDLDTASFWIGRNMTWSEDVEVLAVPMLGAVTGDTDAAALGFELDATWKRVGLYVESEYLFDLDDSDDNFLYTWSELTFAAVDWLGIGLVAQRTRAFDTELDVDRGLMLTIERGRLSGSLYWFNPDRDDSYGAVTFGVSL